MKKLYVNCPVKYRKEKDIMTSIEKMHKMAEIEFDQKLELILPPLEIPSGEKADLDYLSNCIEKIKEADFCVTFHNRATRLYPENWIINTVIRDYNIPAVWVESKRIMPDVEDIVTANDRF
jgi:hypothetical protein